VSAGNAEIVSDLSAILPLMPEQLATFEILMRSAADTERRTRERLRGADEHIPRAIDAIMKLPYFVTPVASPPDASGFRWWAHIAYASAGHSAAALFVLWRQGFYLESTILLRHLLESLVQLRYFGERRDELMPHLTRTREVNFRKLFNVCAPGFYRFYSLLSGAAHGGVASALFRVGLAVRPQWIPRCEYDETRGSIVVNQFVPTLLGLLNLLPQHFPEVLAAAGEEIVREKADSVAWLESAVNAQLTQFPQSTSWLLPLLRLADYSPPTPHGQQ